MFIKLGVIFLILHVAYGENVNQDWELAVVTDDRIELLLSNGSLAGEPFGSFSEFTKLKALTFDNVRHQFVVSDMDQQNDTIFTVQLTKETEIVPIIEDLPDDVQGLTIDPITDILYWTDSINRTISFVHLNDTTYEPNILFSFQDQNPQDITIDVCHQYIYWTNSDINRPTIERSKLDGSHHEILIDSGLHSPAGIAIDYSTQRLFWADIKEGIYYSIESTNLDGFDRQIVYEGTHTKPFGLAVDSTAIYWTDMNNNILWSISKSEKESVPQQIRHFKDKPMGLVAKNAQIANLPDCQQLSAAVKTHQIEEVFKHENAFEPEETVCLNGGELIDGRCRCERGFMGENCEVSLCHNYCVHGRCDTVNRDYPKCVCLRGFFGDRCEKDSCQGYCLNGGSCLRPFRLGGSPQCSCPGGFTGQRCEIAGDVCEGFCRKKRNDVLIAESGATVCRCIDGHPELNPSNFSSLPLVSKEPDFFLDHLQDTAFLAVCCLVLIMFVVNVSLIAYSCSLRRRRTKIKKRFIVNKNLTPLTYRPQPATEQCEITIENCCNMNVCETPCFEPPKLQCLQNKNEDKKKLLEHADEVY